MNVLRIASGTDVLCVMWEKVLKISITTVVPKCLTSQISA